MIRHRLRHILATLTHSLPSTVRAAEKTRLAVPHVCYALALDDDAFYAELLHVSACCVWRIYPAARITVLTDAESLQKAEDTLSSLIDAGARVISVGAFAGSARLRSRFVKTQVRSAVEGDFLYLDADTVAVHGFEQLFACKAPVSAAVDRNHVNPWGGFPAWVVPEFDRLAWPHPTKLYLNTGVVLWRDCDEARALGRLWHDNWLRYTRAVGNPADQPAFNHSLDVLGIEPRIMDDMFNARVGISPEYANGARIYHLLSGNERANGTFIDRLVRRYSASGRVDLSLVEEAAERGHPWIEA